MRLHLIALATLLASSLPLPIVSTPVLANYSCEPGQVGCKPQGPDSHSQPVPWPQIACLVAGDPEALPDDLRFRNIGDVTIPAGTRVLWLVKQTGEHGTFILANDLLAGAEIDDADALKAGLPPRTHCLSRLA